VPEDRVSTPYALRVNGCYHHHSIDLVKVKEASGKNRCLYNPLVRSGVLRIVSTE